jgi:hypothetical protein
MQERGCARAESAHARMLSLSLSFTGGGGFCAEHLTLKISNRVLPPPFFHHIILHYSFCLARVESADGDSYTRQAPPGELVLPFYMETGSVGVSVNSWEGDLGWMCRLYESPRGKLPGGHTHAHTYTHVPYYVSSILGMPFSSRFLYPACCKCDIYPRLRASLTKKCSLFFCRSTDCKIQYRPIFTRHHISPANQGQSIREYARYAHVILSKMRGPWPASTVERPRVDLPVQQLRLQDGRFGEFEFPPAQMLSFYFGIETVACISRSDAKE